MALLEEKQRKQRSYFYLVVLLLFTAVAFCSGYKFGRTVEHKDYASGNEMLTQGVNQVPQ